MVILPRILHPKVVWCAAVWGFILGVSPGKALAIPSESVHAFRAEAERAAQIDAIVQVLSRPEAQVHLRLAGVDQGRLRENLARLDDSQLTFFAQHAESIRSAGVLGVVIALLVIAILIVILIFLLDDKKIEVDVEEKK